MDFRTWVGGEAVINEYCRNLAREGGKRIAEVMGTRLMDESATSEQTLNMTNVELPLHGVPTDKIEFANNVLRDRLLLEHKIYAAHFYHNGKFWTRLSAQIYNEVSIHLSLGCGCQLTSHRYRILRRWEQCL